MCIAEGRNQDLFWRALRPFGDKDLNMVDELLEKSRLAAVEAANLAAELAYIRAFNEIYDSSYQNSVTWIIQENGRLTDNWAEDDNEKEIPYRELPDIPRQRSEIEGDKKVVIPKRPTANRKVFRFPSSSKKVFGFRRVVRMSFGFGRILEKSFGFR